ncbi:MAG: TlpA family protein disulfide reductase [Bacteroidia bacterium]|nr:TlpA family protein disulfide reductase [Bacteroidia bacterium]
MLEVKAIALALGIWRAALVLPENELPFNMMVNDNNGSPTITIVNAEEQIEVTDIVFKEDSIFIYLPVFESEIIGTYTEKEINGVWTKYNDPERAIPFKATHGVKERFITQNDASFDVTGKWEVWFSKDTEDEYKAVGIFKQNGNKVTGTFLTETGDYRYLEGVVENNSLKLSCFDGAHAFLFTANIIGEYMLGDFKSGAHWSEPFVAQKNENVELTDPFKLTYLKEGYDKIAFSFPDKDSTMVSLNDERFKNKVVLVQILGSWCPNCMDESKFLAPLYDKYNEQGLEIVGLAFERSAEFDKAKVTVEKMCRDLVMNYPVLIAGGASKKEASEKLPMLNEIISFPTTILINKKGEVIKIHTGFNGPATGEHFHKFKDEFMAALEGALKE